MKNLKLVPIFGALLLTAACSGGNDGGSKGLTGVSVLHKASECPDLEGKFQEKSRPEVLAQISRNGAGEIVIQFATSESYVVNGKSQKSKDGNVTITSFCSSNTITINARSSAADGETVGVIKPTKTGFVADQRFPNNETETLEYVKIGEANSSQDLEQSSLTKIATRLSLIVKSPRTQEGDSLFGFSDGQIVGHYSPDDGPFCAIVSTDMYQSSFSLNAMTYKIKEVRFPNATWPWFIFKNAAEGDGIVDYFSCVLRKDKKDVRVLTLEEARKAFGSYAEIIVD